MRRAYFLLIIAICSLSACGSDAGVSANGIAGVSVGPGRTTDTESSSIDNAADRVAFLTSYVITPSPIVDTQFHIEYWDNSTGRLAIPGPSDWTINFAAQVDPADLELWTEGFTMIAPIENWDESMLDGWNISTESPVFYHRPGMTRAIYEADNVVIGYAATVPNLDLGPPEG